MPLEGAGGSITAMPSSPPVTVSPKPPAPAVATMPESPRVRSVAPVVTFEPSGLKSTVESARAKLAEPLIRLKTFRWVSEPLIDSSPAMKLIGSETEFGGGMFAAGSTGAERRPVESTGRTAAGEVPPAWLIETDIR